MILAGDVGGTKTQLGIFQVKGKKLQLERSKTYLNQRYHCLEEILAEFTSDTSKHIESACFGIAGPVNNGTCLATTLGWSISARMLAERFSLPSVTLLNDLEAIAHGIELLSPEDFITLNEGEKAEGNIGILAAGTGLGIACLFWNGREHLPSASEGGHIDFAPRNELESDLLHFMLRKYERVSLERVVSGPGIVEIYNFFRASRQEQASEMVGARLLTEDSAEAISASALLGECPIAVKTLELFTSIYGAAAGNLALTILATGGIYIGGGIAPKNISKMRDGTFMKAFLAKGRFAPLMIRIPVRVILNDLVPLIGAARVAARQRLG